MATKRRAEDEGAAAATAGGADAAEDGAGSADAPAPAKRARVEVSAGGAAGGGGGRTSTALVTSTASKGGALIVAEVSAVTAAWRVPCKALWPWQAQVSCPGDVAPPGWLSNGVFVSRRRWMLVAGAAHVGPHGAYHAAHGARWGSERAGVLAVG